ncbi:type I secretion system permease/ATPase [Fulvimarina sp. MAC3]|uniref:type I secretion system permease/ATPase n=1 Tax=Fulvimarina sp. MAC3 TaxID=3148887 RepID=UPI0031FC223E
MSAALDELKAIARAEEAENRKATGSLAPSPEAPDQHRDDARPNGPTTDARSKVERSETEPAQATQPSARAPDEDVVAERPMADKIGKTGPQTPYSAKTIDLDRGPVRSEGGSKPPSGKGGGRDGGGRGGGGGNSGAFHKRLGPVDFSRNLREGLAAIRRNLLVVMLFTCATNVLVLAIPIYLFQISDRVLTSRSIDTLVMLTIVIVGAVLLNGFFDAIRRFILMRTAVECAVKLGAPILSAAARASLHSNGREYQTLGDLQQMRAFLTSGTLLAMLDVPFAPLFLLGIFLVHPDLGAIVVVAALGLLLIAMVNQRVTAKPFATANQHLSRANVHLDSMSRNSQIINALAMIPEAVQIWGRDTAACLTFQVRAQDRNIIAAAFSKSFRLLTQVAMLGWGAYLAIEGEITGGMVIAASIIAGRALQPIEGAIEGWNQFVLSRGSYNRIAALLKASPLNLERLVLPNPQGRLDVERLLYVPDGTKRVVLNALTFTLKAGDSLAIIGDSGAGKTTLGKMLVGSIMPTSGAVRLDLMDIRNWDQRQFGQNIGYLPQDVQLFPGSIKDNIARMQRDASDEDIFHAAQLADVHEMIASLPQGYETIVAADGAPLSGGQKQRIALARAFYGRPRLIVLDEPNSNLDTAGDTALARAIEQAKAQGITIVTITQKPAILTSVDKIMVLSQGAIALMGERTEVLKTLAQRSQGPRLGGQAK